MSETPLGQSVVSQSPMIRGGYSTWSLLGLLLFNSFFACFFLILGSPFMLFIAIVNKLVLRGPIFYHGVRLGLHKRPFVMFKFRTLPLDAQQIIGAHLLSTTSHGTQMLNPWTRFLRDSRLDELPQLFNILKGDMNFIGPRPERPEVYEEMCKHLPNYDLRFLVKPGLIGVSQLFTPHSTPKRVRTMIDNQLVFQKQPVGWVMALTFYTGLIVLKKAVSKGSFLIWRAISTKIVKKYQDMRRLERIVPDEAMVYSQVSPMTPTSGPYHLLDINEEFFKIRCEQPLDESHTLFYLQRQINRDWKKKRKRAYVAGRLFKQWQVGQQEYYYVIHYAPLSPLNQYLVHQYFLEKSIA